MGHSYAVHPPMRPNTGEGEKRKEGKRLEKRRACELGRGRSVSQSPLLPRVNDSELLRTSASTVHTHIAVYNAKVTRIKTENYSQCKRYIIAHRPTLIAARSGDTGARSAVGHSLDSAAVAAVPGADCHLCRQTTTAHLE